MIYFKKKQKQNKKQKIPQVRTVPKSNMKIIEAGTIDTLDTHTRPLTFIA
jgi:hypothetical protein